MVCVLSVLLCGSCTYKLGWEPETIFPPSSLEKAQAKAEEQAKKQAPAIDKPSSMTLSRDGAILSALARNRSLAVARLGPRIALTYVPEAYAQFDPYLMSTVSAGRDTFPINDAEDEVITRDISGNATLSQSFPSGTEVFLSGGLARNRVSPADDWEYTGSWSVGVNQALMRGTGSKVNLVSLAQAQNTAFRSTQEFRGTVLEVVRAVEKAYWQLVLAKETLKIREFSVKLAQEQLQLNLDFIEVGKLSPDARVSAEAELASRKADLVDAQADVEARTIDLIQLLDPEAEAQWSIKFAMADPPDVETVNVVPDISTRLADMYRPELSQARLDLENQKLEVVRTKNGLLPKLDAFASYGRWSSGNSSSNATEYLDDHNFDHYELGLSLELAPGNRAEQARHKRASFKKFQAEAALNNLEQVIQAEVRRAAIEVYRQQQRISATKKVIQSREEELRIEKSRFRVGLSTNLDVLQVERNLIQASLDEVTSRIRYIQAITDLYYAEGTLLERRGVGIDQKK